MIQRIQIPHYVAPSCIRTRFELSPGEKKDVEVSNNLGAESDTPRVDPVHYSMQDSATPSIVFPALPWTRRKMDRYVLMVACDWYPAGLERVLLNSSSPALRDKSSHLHLFKSFHSYEYGFHQR